MVHKRFKGAVFVVGALTAAMLGLSTSPAAASGDISGRAYVHLLNMWGDEGYLSTSRHTYSNATCLWQKILWADGYLTNSGIDGIFGQGTYDATREWQQWRRVGADGVVGPDTFNAAVAGGLAWEGTYQLRYNGRTHDAVITLDEDDRFGFYEDGVHRLAGYNYRTCS